jgi:hypothetical protein
VDLAGEVLVSLESELFILAALFLWMTFFLAALSVKDIARLTFSCVGLFFTARTAISRLVFILLLTSSFPLCERKALLAVLVTGIFRYALFTIFLFIIFHFIFSQWIIRFEYFMINA